MIGQLGAGMNRIPGRARETPPDARRRRRPMDFWETLVRVTPRFLPILLGGAAVAVEVALGAMAVALAGGLTLAILLMAPFRPVRLLARAYVELMRGTPALTQLFIIYFGLPDVGFSLPPLAAAIIGLGANGAAYLAEVFR